MQIQPIQKLRGLVATVFICFTSNSYAAIDAETIQAIEASDCDELVEEYKELVEAEQHLKDAVQESHTQAVATNVVGATALATLGLGFFTWNDTSEAEAYLVEVREYINATKASAQNKKCQLTQPQ